MTTACDYKCEAIVTLIEMFPDVDVLLALSPEEFAAPLLRVAHASMQNGKVHSSHIAMQVRDESLFGGCMPGYPQHRWGEVELAVEEATSWLSKNGSVRGRWRCPSHGASTPRTPLQ